MYKVTRDGTRTVINTSPASTFKEKSLIFNGLALKLIGNASVLAIAAATVGNAWNNPNAENIGLAALFSTAAAYVVSMGEKAKLDQTPMGQIITLDADQIKVETRLLDQTQTETFEARFVELDKEESLESSMASVILKHGVHIIPIICHNDSNEVHQIYNLISKHIIDQRQLAQDAPQPPQ